MYRTGAVVEGLKKARSAIMNTLERTDFRFDVASVQAFIDTQEKKAEEEQSTLHSVERKWKKPCKNLNLENLMTEEERFLISLRNLERLNLNIPVKLGTKRVLCQANFQYHALNIVNLKVCCRMLSRSLQKKVLSMLKKEKSFGWNLGERATNFFYTKNTVKSLVYSTCHKLRVLVISLEYFSQV